MCRAEVSDRGINGGRMGVEAPFFDHPSGCGGTSLELLSGLLNLRLRSHDQSIVSACYIFLDTEA